MGCCDKTEKRWFYGIIDEEAPVLLHSALKSAGMRPKVRVLATVNVHGLSASEVGYVEDSAQLRADIERGLVLLWDDVSDVPMRLSTTRTRPGNKQQEID